MEEIAYTPSRKQSFILKKISLSMLKRKSVDNSVTEFKP